MTSKHVKKNSRLAEHDDRLPQRRLRRTVFVSLPPRYVPYLLRDLAVEVCARYKRLDVDHYKKLRQGYWLEQLKRKIAFCNAVVCVTDVFTPNIMLELGMAMALGKPIIPVIRRRTRVPAMLGHLQVTWFGESGPNGNVTTETLVALDEAVFTILQREKSDIRTKMQKRLLLGARGLTSSEKGSAQVLGGVRRAALDLAREHYVNGRFQDVIGTLTPYIEARGATAEMHHLLADTWFLMGEALEGREAQYCYQKTYDIARRALLARENRGSLTLRKDRGLGLIKLRRLKEARCEFEALVKVYPAANYHYNLACIAALEDMPVEAVVHLEQAIEREGWYGELARVDPDFDGIWENHLLQALVFQKGDHR